MRSKRKTLVTLVLLLLISAFTHGINMFHFPYYENDEGTYMSQAWAISNNQGLAPYTYWYDHAPAGWMLISVWVKLTGGFFTFGPSVNSGRMLMLVLHLLTSTLLFFIAKRLSGKNMAGIIAVLIFSLSPLGIYYQRRVLLDNIMIFWVLLSLILILSKRVRLRNVFLSSIFFGIAVLTKENAFFFMPAFIYALYSNTHKNNRSFAIAGWVTVSILIVSSYFLYALLKGELLPVGFLGDNSQRVSLIDTLRQQFGRGATSDFADNLREWIRRDSFTILVGGIATIISALLSLRVKKLRLPALLAILFWIFLARGKLVLGFYIVPFIPLLSLNIGMLSDLIIRATSVDVASRPALIINSCLCLICLFLVISGREVYTKDETSNQIASIEWIRDNLKADDFIVMDYSFYVDLHEARFEGKKIFRNAEWSWKVEKDSEIRTTKLGDDWTNIDYILLSHETVKQIKAYEFSFIKNAFDNSKLIASWDQDSSSYIDLKNYISTNGDWAAVYKVYDHDSIILRQSWLNYKAKFIKSYGQVVDPATNTTTSEAQAYAMLRSVWLDDQDTFNGVWKWTRDHLQSRTGDKLISWQWSEKDGESRLLDSATATDADLDIALSLLFAYRRWHTSNYLSDAQKIIKDIWLKEIVLINGRYYLTSGTSSGTPEGYLVNLSYISPAHIKIFAEIDTMHPWSTLLQDSYQLLNEATQTLPPNWILVDKKTGLIKPANVASDPSAHQYGYDAFRTFWRVSLDALWFDSQLAKKYLSMPATFFNQELQVFNNIASVYETNGTRVTQNSDVSTNVGALSVFQSLNSDFAKTYYDKLIKPSFNEKSWSWGDPDNYYNQNWGWFAQMMINENFSSLWEKNLVLK